MNNSGISHKKIGGNRRRDSTKRRKNVFLAGVRMQCGLSASYPAWISTILETTDVNRYSGGERREKFPNFCAGSFAGPQNAIFGDFGWGACTQRKILQLAYHQIEIAVWITTKVGTVTNTTKYCAWLVQTCVKQIQDGGGPPS